ncbi:hypothetical protein [Nonomuraea mesophila]|uniref:hypothetical protein n=1 Tax=Nonomuraea mesophila TaxID=2530382 RepID=UPI00140DB86D|nr:hypothetical protein [Nonomuraea mesophila]
MDAIVRVDAVTICGTDPHRHVRPVPGRRRLDPGRMDEAYQTFADPHTTGDLKVVLTRD